MISDNKYPFTTKAGVRRRLENEAAFVVECLTVMQARHELRATGAKTDGPCGWMSSQRSKGAALAKKADAGSLTAHETMEAAKLLQGYAKQIAAALRERAVAADPSLADAARVFGVLPRASANKVQPKPAKRPPAAPEPAAEGQDEQERYAGGEPEGGEHDDALELRDLVLSHLSIAPGSRSEEVAKAIGVTTAMLSPMLRELVNAGRLRSTGIGRGTRYTAR